MIRMEPKAVVPVPAPAAASAQILPPFDYAKLTADQAALAREAAAFIESRQKVMASSAIEIGRKLNDVKASLGHGNFTAWLSSSFVMTPRTAQNYMQAATALADKSETVSYLPVGTVYEIARVPEPIRAEVMEKLETAPAPVPAKEVSNIIWRAQEAAKEAAKIAKMTPAGRKRHKEQREKEKAEYGRRKLAQGKQAAARERALVRLAELLLSKLGEDAGEVAMLLKETDFRGETLADRLSNGIYGNQPFTKAKLDKESWPEWVALIESGDIAHWALPR